MKTCSRWPWARTMDAPSPPTGGCIAGARTSSANWVKVIKTHLMAPNWCRSWTGVWAMAAGGEHTCVIQGPERGVVCWGRSLFGEVGTGESNLVITSPTETGLTGIAHIDSGPNSSMAIDQSGELWAWGNNTFGELGVCVRCASPHPYTDRVSGQRIGGGSQPHLFHRLVRQHLLYGAQLPWPARTRSRS